MKRLLLFLMVFIALKGSYAQTSQFRLIAKSVYSCDSLLNYKLADSATYAYSSGRGSNMKTGVYLYDSSVNYQMQTGSLSPAQLYNRTYGDSNRVAVHSYARRISNSWRYVSRTLFSYFPNGMLDSTVADNWDSTSSAWHSNYRYKYYYTAGNLDSVQWKKNVGGTWNIEARELYGYTSGNLTAHHILVWNDTAAHWDSLQTKLYTYTTSSRVKEYMLYIYDSATGMLAPAAMQFYDYDTKGMVKEHTYSYWDQTTMQWEGNDQHLYTYTAGGNVDVETVNSWDMINQLWTPYKIRQFAYDAKSNPLTLFEKAFSGWTFLNNTLQTWTYNADGLPVSDIILGWSDPANKWVPLRGDNAKTYYYYEAIPDGITMRERSNAGMLLFPNPAQDYINIKLQWKDAKPFTVKIYDTRGRLVYAVSEAGVTIYNKTLPLAGFTPGTYFVVAHNGSEEMTKHLVIGNQ